MFNMTVQASLLIKRWKFDNVPKFSQFSWFFPRLWEFVCYLPNYLLSCISVSLCSDYIVFKVDVTKTVQCSDNEKAGEGDKVTVHYGGFLMNGTKFDSSFDRARPFTFELGVGQVIPGWDQVIFNREWQTLSASLFNFENYFSTWWHKKLTKSSNSGRISGYVCHNLLMNIVTSTENAT